MLPAIVFTKPQYLTYLNVKAGRTLSLWAVCHCPETVNSLSEIVVTIPLRTRVPVRLLTFKGLLKVHKIKINKTTN